MKNIQLKFLTEICIYHLYYRHIFKENSNKNYVEVYCYCNVGIQFIASYVVSPEETYCFRYYDIDMNIISNAIDFNHIITEALDKEFGV